MSEINDRDKKNNNVVQFNDKKRILNRKIAHKLEDEKIYSKDDYISDKELNRRERTGKVGLAEFILRYTDNKVNLSIESLAKNESVNRKFAHFLQNEEANILCNKICSEIDRIIDIDNNKNTLINLIKSMSTIDKKIPLYTLYMEHYTDYNGRNEEIDSDVEIIVMIEDMGLKYLQNNNEFNRMINYMKQNLDDFVKLGSILYLAVNESYDEYIDAKKLR